MGIGWGPGGPTDSVNRFVAHEVRRQLAGNPVARRARYPAGHRLLRSLMGAPFSLFLARYLIVDLAVLNVEAWSQIVAPDAAVVSTARAAQIVDIVKTVPSYLLGAQIGLLGIISLALALVTLIVAVDTASISVPTRNASWRLFPLNCAANAGGSTENLPYGSWCSVTMTPASTPLVSRPTSILIGPS